MNEKKKMKRGDFIMLMGAGVVAGGLFLWTGSTDLFRRMTRSDDDPLMAKIEQNGSVTHEIDLTTISEEERIALENDLNVIIEVQPGQIRFQHSDCPDNICVNTGWLTREGHNAVCLPARTVVSVG
ncbi:NusG domain II-containing protein [Salisediminibacterium beveridgei]|uniref:Uncharacterized protein n=1 Tax=Salisediminibacterium beveridgei TaxID=632773 RepID=A0A1D7QYE3_9BACI|nr:NusG domain II-containing protein [Salisediminibacterium beveridgei]AOM84019.1 hypothetical protein BBEV_2681 [Salisediminibacterium beveridgei]